MAEPLVSHAAGSPAATGDGSSSIPAISADGGYVSFYSTSRNLLPGFDDRNGYSGDVFLYDRQAATTALVSRTGTAATVTGNAGSFQNLGWPSLSADGRYVAFLSEASDMVAGIRDFNNDQDVFVFDRTAGASAIASATATPSATWGGPSFAAAVSADGRYTAFASPSGRLLPGPEGGSNSQIYLYDRTYGTKLLVSRARSSATTPANGLSEAPSISADGRFVAFASTATNLVSGVSDSPGKDVFLYDRASGAMVLVSRSSASPTMPGNGDSDTPAISSDGRYVAFRSRATNLVPGQSDGNSRPDVFLYDRITGTTTLISRSSASATITGDRESGTPVLSVDGRFVAFTSSATDLVPGQQQPEGFFWTNVFLYDRLSGAMILVSRSHSSSTAPGNRDSLDPAMSADGRFVAFTSLASDLVPGQSDSSFSRDAFLFDRIAGTVTLVSHSAASPSVTGDGDSDLPSLSAEGSFVAFRSEADNLVPGQAPSPDAQVFLYDRTAGTMRMVSRSAGTATTPGNGASGAPALSADGRRIAYASSSTDLVAGQTDTPDTFDVFLFDRTAETTVLVSHPQGMPNHGGNSGSDLPVISSDGSAVGFSSIASDLVPDDFNGLPDAFLYSDPLPGSDFFTVAPCRLIDTRQPGQGPALASGVSEIWTIPGTCGIPATARAIAVNVTVVQPTGTGHLSFAPGDFGEPLASTINFAPGKTRANNDVLPLAANGLGTLRVFPAVTGNGTVHAILDVFGYFE